MEVRGDDSERKQIAQEIEVVRLTLDLRDLRLQVERLESQVRQLNARFEELEAWLMPWT